MTINICRNDLIADNVMAIIEGKKKKSMPMWTWFLLNNLEIWIIFIK